MRVVHRTRITGLPWEAPILRRTGEYGYELCHMTRTEGLTLAALGLTVTLWASAFPGIRAALEWYTPEHLAVVRNLVAGGAFAVYAAATHLRPPVARDLPGILLIGLLGTIQQLALNYGARTVSAGAVSFLVGTVPIFTALLAIAFLGERLHVWGWMGILTSFCGIGLIGLAEGEGMRFSPGALFVVLASFAESLMIVLMKPYLVRYRALPFAAYRSWAAALFLLVYVPGLPEVVQAVPRGPTFTVVYLGIFPLAVANVIWGYVLSRTSASSATSFFYAVPALAILIAWCWLGEVPSGLSVAGGILAVLGVMMVNTRARNQT
jgi:drug/metabolite transporter (DMT)-like permease